MPTIRLPAPNRELRPFELPPSRAYDAAGPGEKLPRKALAAAHVVVDPWADNAPWTGVALDMQATLKSYDSLIAMAGGLKNVIPGHDPLILKRYPAWKPETQGLVHKLDAPRIG